MRFRFCDVLGAALIQAGYKLHSLPAVGNNVVRQGSGFGDLEDDTEIEADLILGEFFENFFLKQPWCGRVVVEGRDPVDSEGEYVVYVDPLDNSQAFYSRGDTLGFPYSACVHVMPKGKNLFQDIEAGAVIDFRSKDLFCGEKIDDGYVSVLNGKILKASEKELDVAGRTDTIITDLYYLKNRKMLPLLFPEEKGIFRNPGSAAMEMVYPVLENVALYFCFSQKMHELGAAYIINKGAGREVLHLWNGDDIGHYDYDFNDQVPVLIARNMKVVRNFWRRVDTAKMEGDLL